MKVYGAETLQRVSLVLPSGRKRREDFLEEETFVLEQVGVCSEGAWKGGILVTEAQKELVSHLVWLDQGCERRRETDEIGEGTRG